MKALIEPGDTDPRSENGHALTCPVPEVTTESNNNYCSSGGSQAKISAQFSDQSELLACQFVQAQLLPETQQLPALEHIIEIGLGTFYIVGSALRQIRDSKLYRNEYHTFEQYCEDRWNIKRQRAYELMQAAAVVANLSEISDKLPSNEAQARELSGLTSEQQRDVYQQAVATAPKGKLTAKHIRDVRGEVTGSEPVKPPRASKVECQPAASAELCKRFADTWEQKWLKFCDRYLADEFHSSQHNDVRQLIRRWFANKLGIRFMTGEQV
jgi:hypothetical protein